MKNATVLYEQNDSNVSLIISKSGRSTIILLGVLVFIIGISNWARADVTMLGQEPQLRSSLADLDIVQPTLALAEVIAYGTEEAVDSLVITIALKQGVESFKLTPHTMIIDYRDHNQRVDNIAWTWHFLDGDEDQWLEQGEQLQLWFDTKTSLSMPMAPGTEFVIDIKPTIGAILTIHYALPMQLDSQVVLE